MINRRGDTHINILAIVFVVLVILFACGKIGFWEMILFPFKIIGGCIGIGIGIVAAIAIICGVIWGVCYLIDKKNGF